ncbi:E3 ubiquitin-protein ligase rnf13 [Podila epigama]|nr:E3 ubiquitin-protein ligase rnf13 [Podila epigama]
MPALATSMITLQNHSASHSPELSQSSKLLASTTLNTNQESTQEHSTTVVVTTDGTLEDLCSICLGEYETNDRIRILPCNHEYHAECVDIWLTHKSTHCPLCKHDLLNDVESTVPAMFPSPSL